MTVEPRAREGLSGSLTENPWALQSRARGVLQSTGPKPSSTSYQLWGLDKFLPTASL